MKYLSLALLLALGACATNPTTGAKTVDWAKVVAGIRTLCANQTTIAGATQAAAAAVQLSTATTGTIASTENLISIGCALLPPPTSAAPAG